MFKDLASRFKDEFYQLERSLFAKAGDDQTRVIQFTSSHFGEGVTSVSLALACFLARQRPSDQIIVVEANLRQPSFEEIFALKSEGNLLAVLDKSKPLRQAITRLPDYNFMVIPAGSSEGTQTLVWDELDLDRLGEILAVLKKKCRYVIVDSPPAVPFIDAVTICGMTDGVVVVVESERTRSEVVDHAIEKLKSGGAEILGTILNKREFRIPKRVYRFL